tara:strand:+ start:6670 stop:6789 length:120 start_codon:yes stop_codon:yes gene_type:complete
LIKYIKKFDFLIILVIKLMYTSLEYVIILKSLCKNNEKI